MQSGFYLLYLQMIVDRTGKIVGAEALTRWQNREKGLLSPGVFVEPLKSAGLIDKLGGLNDALNALHKMIDASRQKKVKKSEK